MKVTRSAVYKLEVMADCGCKAVNEYTDSAYKKPVSLTGTVFSTCAKHVDAPGIEFLATVLTEAVIKEALESVPPPQVHAPVTREGVPPQVAEGGSVSRTPLPASAEGGVVHRAAERGPRRDPLKINQRVHSGGSSGGSSRSAAPTRSGVSIGGKVASQITEVDGFSFDLEDEAAEDENISAIMEEALPGILPATEGAGDEFDIED